MKRDECRLCRKTATLRNSHILPEFLYHSMYDSLHRYHAIRPRLQKPIGYEQKGLREYLLCQGCETQISVYEKYIKEAFYLGKNVVGEKFQNSIRLTALNYKLTRLYHLSLLWRMSVSTREEFEAIRLGPHEERVRKLLVSEDPGDPLEYGVIATLPSIGGEIHDSWIMQPALVRDGGHRFYRAVIGGILYLFATSRDAVSTRQAALLTISGDWTIPILPVERIPFLMQAFGEYQELNERVRTIEASVSLTRGVKRAKKSPVRGSNSTAS